MSLCEVGAYSWSEAHIVIGRLASEGIAAVAFDAGTHLIEGSCRLMPVRVMVGETDLAAARYALDVAVRDAARDSA